MKMKKEDPKDDFLPGDDVCRTCTGITYMSQLMREERKIPWCIGMRKTLTAKIPQQRLEQFEKEAEKDFVWQISIGNCGILHKQEISQEVVMNISPLTSQFIYALRLHTDHSSNGSNRTCSNWLGGHYVRQTVERFHDASESASIIEQSQFFK